MDKMKYAPCVKFYGEKSKYDNCICTGCHNTGRVLKFKLPYTGFRPTKYNTLVTRYQEYWLCDDCLDKLLNTIVDAETKARQIKCEIVFERFDGKEAEMEADSE